VQHAIFCVSFVSVYKNLFSHFHNLQQDKINFVQIVLLVFQRSFRNKDILRLGTAGNSGENIQTKRIYEILFQILEFVV
jgi:hypothetical protein